MLKKKSIFSFLSKQTHFTTSLQRILPIPIYSLIFAKQYNTTK